MSASKSFDQEPLSTPGASSSTSFLSYPTERDITPPPSVEPPDVKIELSKNRLYVGNLHQTVDEHAFLQIFSKFGKISKLDFLFFKTGPNKGKPRGYAFVEYTDPEDASKAQTKANGKLLRGRKITVTYANQAPSYDSGSGYNSKYPHRRFEAQRPTALSLIKGSGQKGRTEDKIAALEAKLNQMQQAPTSTSTLTHPSLPRKPLPSVPGFDMNSDRPRPDKRKHMVPQTPASVKSDKLTGTSRHSFGSAPMSIRSSSLMTKPTLEQLMKDANSVALTPSSGVLKR